jgi:sec-independent protein translocase protein TatB
MFDVSFSELVLILIVGLLVFGPEKLPEVVRTASLWIGKIRRTFNNIRTEIEREVGVDELKRDLHNQSIMDSLKDVHNDLRKTHSELAQLPHELYNSTIANDAATKPLADKPLAEAVQDTTPPLPDAAPALTDSVTTDHREHHHHSS